jgi:3-hydroxyacyl-CoA dehydrogenase
MMEKLGKRPAKWIYDFIAEGNTAFYKIEKDRSLVYDVAQKNFKFIPGSESYLMLQNIKQSKTIWKNSGSSIVDIGDGVLNLEFHTKMNSIGGEVIQGMNKAIELAEKDYKGLVISNEGPNFSAGANVGMIFMMAVEQEWDELNFAIKAFQNTMMRVRYSSIPVVVAPHN